MCVSVYAKKYRKKFAGYEEIRIFATAFTQMAE